MMLRVHVCRLDAASGHANGHVRVRRDVRAVDPRVRLGDGALLQRELGLDRSAARASKQLVSGKNNCVGMC